MYKFLKIQYEMGRLTKERLHAYVPKYITEERYLEIIGEGGSADDSMVD